MQHYIHYGLGFNADILTKAEADNLYYNSGDDKEDEIGIRLVPFTEDYCGKGWGTVVIKYCEMIPEHGKMITFADLKTLCSKEMIIDIPTKEKIKIALDKFDLGHLLEKVEVIIYSENY